MFFQNKKSKFKLRKNGIHLFIIMIAVPTIFPVYAGNVANKIAYFESLSSKKIDSFRPSPAILVKTEIGQIQRVIDRIVKENLTKDYSAYNGEMARLVEAGNKLEEKLASLQKIEGEKAVSFIENARDKFRDQEDKVLLYFMKKGNEYSEELLKRSKKPLSVSSATKLACSEKRPKLEKLERSTRQITALIKKDMPKGRSEDTPPMKFRHCSTYILNQMGEDIFKDNSTFVVPASHDDLTKAISYIKQEGASCELLLENNKEDVHFVFDFYRRFLRDIIQSTPALQQELRTIFKDIIHNRAMTLEEVIFILSSFNEKTPAYSLVIQPTVSVLRKVLANIGKNNTRSKELGMAFFLTLTNPTPTESDFKKFIGIPSAKGKVNVAQ